jgi:hypothetical protein
VPRHVAQNWYGFSTRPDVGRVVRDAEVHTRRYVCHGVTDGVLYGTLDLRKGFPRYGVKLSRAHSVMSLKSPRLDGIFFVSGSADTSAPHLVAARTRFVWNVVTPSMTL